MNTTSTDALPVRIPGASGHTPAWDDDRSPADRRAFMAASYVRGQHIPSARTAAGSYTRAGLDDAIRQAAQDEPRIPAFDDAWGRPSAWAAFGDGAA